MAFACPSDDELVRLVEGDLRDQTLASIESHVDSCERCAAVIASLGAMEPSAPRAAGRYQLDRRIAAGGMGEVWAAWDPELRRDVAVKLVRPDRSDEGRERERMLREARALARLQHQNVLAVYDVGEIDGEVFIVSELVVGETLGARGGASVDWRALARLYTQAARGLAAAHQAGLVHRDVKPANLLVGADGRVRVADFGLAIGSVAALSRAPTAPQGNVSLPRVTAPGHVAGTPLYMAPEQRAGEPADARADQYALCLALVEGIDGRIPPAFLDAPALVAFVAERRSRAPALEQLCVVLARGMSLEPEQRFPSMAALADAIEATVATTTAEPASVAPLRATAPRRRRALSPVVIGGLVVLAGAVAFAAWTTSRDDGERARRPRTPVEHLGAPQTVADASTPPPQVGSAAPAPSTDAAVHTAIARVAAPTRTAALPSRAATPQAVIVAPPPPAPAAPAAPSSSTLPSSEIERAEEAVQAAAFHHDANACSAALVGLDSSARATALRGVCMMVGGDCDGGAHTYVVAWKMPDSSAALIADSYCSPGRDSGRRLKRLVQQTTGRANFDCRYYLPFARAAEHDAKSEQERTEIDAVLSRIAKCFGTSGDCDTARDVWRDVVALNPREQGLVPDIGAKCN